MYQCPQRRNAIKPYRILRDRWEGRRGEERRGRSVTFILIVCWEKEEPKKANCGRSSLKLQSNRATSADPHCKAHSSDRVSRSVTSICCEPPKNEETLGFYSRVPCRQTITITRTRTRTRTCFRSRFVSI